MIDEFARLTVKTGQEQDFERAFDKAKEIISRMSGFVSLALYRHHDEGGVYLLHVVWQDISSHRDGFRGSPDYQEWKTLLHHFYKPFPKVEYFEPVVMIK